MQSYADLGRDSGIKSYSIGEDYIIVEFKLGSERFYRYTDASAGLASIEIMKRLAVQGQGLNSYITRSKPRFSSKAVSLTML